MTADVLFIAGFEPIDRDISQSRALYAESLGIPFKGDADGYLYTGALQGAKHFALWPLAKTAQSCFGANSWPTDIPLPQHGWNLRPGGLARINLVVIPLGWRLHLFGARQQRGRRSIRSR